MKPINSLILLLSPAILLAAANTQAQADLRNRLHECAEVANVLERLACYDEIANDDSATPAQQPTPATSSPVVTRPPASPPPQPVIEAEPAGEDDTADFGQAQARIETTDAGEKALVDTITEVKALDATKVLITLASGQVWRQTVGKRFLLREGDTVRITPSAWGEEYRLYVDGKRGFIQVRRAR